MTELPPEVEIRRRVENIAIELGQQRREANDLLAHNTFAVMELLRDPDHDAIPFDHLASLLGVSRQTLYRWRTSALSIPERLTIMQAAAMRQENGEPSFNLRIDAR